NGIIHASIGKIAFEANHIQENLAVLLEALNKAKPSSAKGTFIKKISLSTTMGAGVSVDQASLDA
ncbi:MAG: 50S ribosomal protein L1, partial [Paraglaciecola sp.]|nr:50S ribosomal protein L1 [Paraglaciecola sp.]